MWVVNEMAERERDADKRGERKRKGNAHKRGGERVIHVEG